MTGIFLLVLLGFWTFVCIQVVRLAIHRVSSRAWRVVVAPVVFVPLFIMPVIDEIIGSFQFRSLCERNAVLRIDANEGAGKTVRLAINPANEIVPGQLLTTYHTRVAFVEVATSREIGSYSSYEAKGGWLIRALGVSETNAPLTMNSSCAPQLGAYGMAKAYKFNIVE